MTPHTKQVVHGGFLLSAVLLTNFLNFLFNALLGRWLSFEDFGLVTLLVTLYYISSIVTNALSSTMNVTIASSERDHHHQEAGAFFIQTLRRSLCIALGASMLFLLASPLLAPFFQVHSLLFFVSVVPIILGSTFSYLVIGFLQGNLSFTKSGIVYLTEAIAKLIVGIVLALTGMGIIAFLSIPASLLILSIAALIALKLEWKPNESKASRVSIPFPTHLFLTSVGAGIGSTLFFSLDLLLVRHFFSPTLAGQYALVSLIGKMVYFFITILNIFTLPLVARSKSALERQKLFWLLMGGTGLLALCAWIGLGPLGPVFVPLLFGAKVAPILSLLPLYTLGIALYALANVLASFHLARKEYRWSYQMILAGLVFATLILFRHATLQDITVNCSVTCGVLFLSLLIQQFFYHQKGALT